MLASSVSPSTEEASSVDRIARHSGRRSRVEADHSRLVDEEVALAGAAEGNGVRLAGPEDAPARQSVGREIEAGLRTGARRTRSAPR